MLVWDKRVPLSLAFRNPLSEANDLLLIVEHLHLGLSSLSDIEAQ